MPSLDDVFDKEFRAMMNERKSMCPNFNAYSLGLPKIFFTHTSVSKHLKARLSGITEGYYSALNNTEVLILSRPNLKKRKFNSKGEFLTNSDGSFVYDDVTVPNNCVAILSDDSIGVPYKYKPKEEFSYVDYKEKIVDTTRKVKYIYIVPKKYCYKLNQTALVLSLNKMHKYYLGMEMALQNGFYAYLYVIGYKPTESERSYRVLDTRTDLDYSQDIDEINRAWLRGNILFDKNMCEFQDQMRGKTNAAFEVFPSTLDEFVRYDPDKSLMDTSEDVDYDIAE